MQKRVGVEASEASNRRIPMPKFVIERQYLVPMYQHIAVEAESLEEGLVTETGSGERNRVGCRHGPAQLSPPSVPARDHPARDLALSPVHPELPRCRGAAGRARTRHLLRNGATLGAEIRSRDRATAAPAAPSAEQPMAPGRDGGADRREADVPLGGRRSRGRGPRPACPAPARQPGGPAADAQAAQEARLRAEIAGLRQIALLRRGVPPFPTDLST